MAKRTAEETHRLKERMFGERDERLDIFEQANYLEKKRVERELTVVRSKLQRLQEDFQNISFEVLCDPIYFEMAEGIMEDMQSAINKLLEMEERLEEDLYILGLEEPYVA